MDVEDLLVQLADAVWKGQRRQELEEAFLARIVAATGLPQWQVFLTLDEILDGVAADATERLE